MFNRDILQSAGYQAEQMELAYRQAVQAGQSDDVRRRRRVTLRGRPRQSPLRRMALPVGARRDRGQEAGHRLGLGDSAGPAEWADPLGALDDQRFTIQTTNPLSGQTQRASCRGWRCWPRRSAPR